MLEKKKQELRFNEFLIASIGGLKNWSQGDYTIKENKINAEDFCGNIFFLLQVFLLCWWYKHGHMYTFKCRLQNYFISEANAFLFTIKELSCWNLLKLLNQFKKNAIFNATVFMTYVWWPVKLENWTFFKSVWATQKCFLEVFFLLWSSVFPTQFNIQVCHWAA